MVTGFFCVPLFKFVVPLIPVWGPIISPVEELAPSMFLAIVVGVLVTKLMPRPASNLDRQPIDSD